MPYPSAGCRTCKIRRIKCDETKPKCQRCTKSRRSCLRDSSKQGCFSIHSENCYASGETKRPRGPRSAWRAQSLGHRNEGAILRRPYFDLQTRALVIYLHHHLQTPTDLPSICKGLSDCVCQWSSRAILCPMVDLAISSMALAVYSRTQQHPAAATEASVKYQQLLRITQATIPTLNEGNIDACLLAIFLMSRYEGVIHRPSRVDSKPPFVTSLQSFSHHDGAMAILKIWKCNLSRYDQPATDIIKHTRRGIIRSALLRNLTLPKWIMNGSLFGEYDLELEYDRILVQIVNFRPQLSILLQEETDLQTVISSYELTYRAQELSNEARDIDNAMQAWTGQIPNSWAYQRHILTDIHHPYPGRHFYSSTVYSYSSHAYAAVWNKFFAMRLLLSSTRLRILELLRSPSTNSDTYADKQQREECLSDMKSMADALASSVPYCLQKVRIAKDGLRDSSSVSPDSLITLNEDQEISPYMASLIVWPLTIASSLEEGLDLEQKLWFGSELAHLGRVVGSSVLEFAETDTWLHL